MFFLYHSTTRPTGKWLARALGARGFGTCKTLKQRPVDFLIRWGNSDQEERDGRTAVIQTARAIRAASDKLAAFRLLAEADVSIPRFTTSADEANGWGTTVFGRTRHGAKGHGITVFQPGDARWGHALYTEFVPNTREYRLHVVGGNVVRVQRKYLEREELNGDGFIKNHDHGYVFKQPQKALNTTRTDAAVAACAALGLDFGAVDMVIDERGKEYILEVNTAPSCSPLTGKSYVEALAALIHERTGREVIPNLAVLDALAARG